MTRDDIIKLARESGGMQFESDSMDFLIAEVVKFGHLIAAAEREACAKVCDFEVARLSAIDEPRPALAVGICAAAIRARGNT